MRTFKYFSIILTLASCHLWAQDLEIINIRVGQGDATLIKGPPDNNGKSITILVDGGNIRGVDGGNVIRTVMYKRNITALDYIIITHYDADHIGGIVSGNTHGISLLLGWNKTPGNVGDDDNDGFDGWIDDKKWSPDPEELGTGDDIPVSRFVDRGDVGAGTTQAYQKYLLMAEAHNNRISLNNEQDVENFEIDLGNGASIIALAANGYVRDRAARVANVNTENERSLSLLLSYNKFHYLISGDLIGRRFGSENAKIEKAVGEYIKDNNIIVDVLHVNHHGGNNASESSFLNNIKPTIAIISAGNGNSHNHPNRNVLKRLVDANVYRIIQTSWGTTRKSAPKSLRKIQAIYQNDVEISSDGNTYTISTSRKFKADKNPND